MKVEGCTQFIHFVSLFSFFTFVRQLSDKDRLTASDGRTDGDGVTGDGSRLSHDGDGNLENISKKFPIQAPPP